MDIIGNKLIKKIIRKYVFDLWQREWDLEIENKLYRIQPKLSEQLPKVQVEYKTRDCSKSSTYSALVVNS